MTDIKILPIKDIIKSYDVLLLDIWGVVHNGVTPYPGAINFINEMLASDKIIMFISNNPRPGYLTNKQFADFGLNTNKIVTFTSGDAVREQLVLWNDEVFSKLGKKLFHVGSETNQDILSGIAANVVDDISNADFLLITAFVNSIDELSKYDEIFKKAAELKIPAICVNPDLVAHFGNQIRYCAGNFTKRFESFGGKAFYYGKPDSKIYNALLSKYLFGVNKQKILIVGDTLETDILGANNVGIDSALVLTGNGEEIGNKLLAGNPDVFKDAIAKPTWVTYGIKG